LQCRSGERLAVIRPNGAGKSTLFALLGGFMRPEFGTIWFEGQQTERIGAELARAWATRPRLILLDEVGAGLTSQELEQLADTLASLNATHGTTILFIEHMMSMVGRLADRVIVLHHGEILAEGSLASVSANPVVIEAYLGETALAA
jgi:ABC-type branched-subunit amino acid transport system ATPase component